MFSYSNNRRWSDINKHWWRFTYCPRTSRGWKPFSIMLSSAKEEVNRNSCHYYDGCNLRLQFRGYTLIVELPEIIKPLIITRRPKDKDTYIIYKERVYGFSLNSSDIHIKHGAQSDSSNEAKYTIIDFPWRQRRFISETYFKEDGSVDNVYRESKTFTGISRFHIQRLIEEGIEKSCFLVEDYDGEVVKATTYTSETMYKQGTGYFAWISLLCKPNVRRMLNIKFEKETGSEKGSWKGGLMGCSFDVLPGDTLEETFKKFCLEPQYRSGNDKPKFKYLGRA